MVNWGSDLMKNRKDFLLFVIVIIVYKRIQVEELLAIVDHKVFVESASCDKEELLVLELLGQFGDVENATEVVVSKSVDCTGEILLFRNQNQTSKLGKCSDTKISTWNADEVFDGLVRMRLHSERGVSTRISEVPDKEVKIPDGVKVEKRATTIVRITIVRFSKACVFRRTVNG